MDEIIEDEEKENEKEDEEKPKEEEWQAVKLISSIVGSA